MDFEANHLVVSKMIRLLSIPNTITVIEIVPEQQVLLTGQLFEILEKSSITFQDIRRVQETLYQRNCRLLKKYLTTGKMDENVTNEQLFMAPILTKTQ